MHHQLPLRQQGHGLTVTAEADAGNGAPEIDALLSRLGLGPLGSLDEAASLPGRNQTCAGITSLGNHVVVKRFRGSASDASRRLQRSIAFERTVGTASPRWFAAPRCAGWDEDARLMAFEFVEGARSGADLLLAAEWDDGLARQVGLAVGELHGIPASVGPDGSWATADRAVPALPSAELLAGLPVGVYAACSAAELQAWSLLQHDPPLADAIGRLLRLQDQAEMTPAHCDFRLEQLFVAAGRLYLCDWEEFRIADPARDVGSFAGEWLHYAVMTMTGSDADAEALSQAEIVRRIAGSIERVRPRIAAFWAGYRSVRPAAGQDLAARAAAFAGWHMFDRMLAIARRSARLRAVDRAAAGIGRTILLSPTGFAQTLGLEM
ncbi:MAG TPA: class V lanthionine synthetase subunit LxmK [Streptosporangiaceae bacterium]|nr:class V lanthionine synthetase subunit LxmK [Streptosporangiaceae bacterium]